jgi:hypothetical protein
VTERELERRAQRRLAVLRPSASLEAALRIQLQLP